MTKEQEQDEDRRSKYRAIVNIIVEKIVEYADQLIYAEVIKLQTQEHLSYLETEEKEKEIFLQTIQALKSEFLYSTIVRKEMVYK